MRISDWSSDVCSSDLEPAAIAGGQGNVGEQLADVPRQRRYPRCLVGIGGVVAQHEAVILDRGAATRGGDDHRVEPAIVDQRGRSEEHTSELQSLMRISYAVFCLKKKKTNNTYKT